jgi:hypothetical protein
MGVPGNKVVWPRLLNFHQKLSIRSKLFFFKEEAVGLKTNEQLRLELSQIHFSIVLII